MRICVFFFILLLKNVDFISFLKIRIIFIIRIKTRVSIRFHAHFLRSKNIDFIMFIRIYAFLVMFLSLYKFL